MRQYLLSVYQPAGDPPPPELLDQIRRDLDAVNRDLEAAGAWVFAGGLHAPATATVLRPHDGDVLMTDGPRPGCRPAPPAGSSRPRATARSTGCAARRRARRHGPGAYGTAFATACAVQGALALVAAALVWRAGAHASARAGQRGSVASIA